jgi:hypothetical protein
VEDRSGDVKSSGVVDSEVATGSSLDLGEDENDGTKVLVRPSSSKSNPSMCEERIVPCGLSMKLLTCRRRAICGGVASAEQCTPLNPSKMLWSIVFGVP